MTNASAIDCAIEGDDPSAVGGNSTIFFLGCAFLVFFLGGYWSYKAYALGEKVRALEEAEHERAHGSEKDAAAEGGSGEEQGRRDEESGGVQLREQEDVDPATNASGPGKKPKVSVKLPAMKKGSKWVKDSAFEMGLVAGITSDGEGSDIADGEDSGRGCCTEFIDNYGVDAKIFEIVRDWTQVMALLFSQVAPAVPSFTSSFGAVFNLLALDIGNVIPALKGLWDSAIYIAAIVLFLAFNCCMRMASNPDALEDGAETVNYAEQNQASVKKKLLILQGCHFMYLPVCRTVFVTWHDYLYMGVPSNFFFPSIFIFLFFIVSVPRSTHILIRDNKPRGSTEDPDHVFDAEGHKVRLTDEVYTGKVREMMDTKSPAYNPWAGLFSGYERAWAEFPVFVMVLKLTLTLGVVFLAQTKVKQSMHALLIIFVWAAVVKMAGPYISRAADFTDLSAKLSQLVTALLSVLTVLVCKSNYPECASHCYKTEGEPGFVIGILTNVFAGICLLFQIYMTVTAMPFYILRQKNRRGMFELSEYDAVSRLESTVDATAASAIYNLSREKKFRLWMPFWDGLFEEFGDQPAEEGHDFCPRAVSDRWKEIKSQAMDAGVTRIMEWLEQSDAGVLDARDYVTSSLEGIDVYCDKDNVLKPDENGNCSQLIETSKGGDKVLSTETSFAKMYVTPFPMRAMIVWDDCEDRGMLYDEDMVRLVAVNKRDDVADKTKLRKELRSLCGETVQYAFWRMEKKTVGDGKDKDGKSKTKQVSVKISYKAGAFSIGQTVGKNTMETAKTKFDLSAGFVPYISYNDGSGRTDEGDGKTFTSESTTVSWAEIGLTKLFARGTLGCNKRDGMDRNPGIDDLLSENRGLVDAKLNNVLAQHQTYRDEQAAKRAAREAILTAKFWPMVYNNCDQTKEAMNGWLTANTSEPFAELIAQQGAAQEYLWSRHEFVSESFENLYWFTFWDDVWTNNFKMAVLKDEAAVFGSASPGCLIYNPCPYAELKAKLEKMGLVGTLASPKHHFFPELLSRLYGEMGRAEQAYNLDAPTQRQFLLSSWQDPATKAGGPPKEEEQPAQGSE